jgi:hypothetical protein
MDYNSQIESSDAKVGDDNATVDTKLSDPKFGKLKFTKKPPSHRNDTSASEKTLGRPAGYSSWANMKQRCSNPKNPHYKDYGGRGIVYCKEWQYFDNFISDLGPPPTNNSSVDRLDVNGNYCKENCIWATPKSQARNRRSNKIVVFEGIEMTIAELAERKSIDPSTLRARLKSGMPVYQAASRPISRGGDRTCSPEMLSSPYDKWPEGVNPEYAAYLEGKYERRNYREHSRPEFFHNALSLQVEDAFAILNDNPELYDDVEIEKASRLARDYERAKDLSFKHNHFIKTALAKKQCSQSDVAADELRDAFCI